MRPLVIARVFAVVGCMEFCWYEFLTPYLSSRSFRMGFEMLVALLEMAIYRSLAFRDRLVIAVMDDRLGHPAEYRFNDVQKLGAGR